jgi:hypothetical protein
VSSYPQACGFCSHCFSKASCGLPAGGGTSFVSESGWLGFPRLGGPVPPLPVPVDPVGVVVVAGAVVVAGIGEVTGGIETVGAVVSPESSLPQPAIARPMTRAVTAR